jgi:hypothetical protein
MKVQIVTPYRLSHLPRYGVTERGNVTSVYPPSDAIFKSWVTQDRLLCRSLANNIESNIFYTILPSVSVRVNQAL